MKRLKDLCRDIDAIIADNEYYDDDTEETVCEISDKLRAFSSLIQTAEVGKIKYI